jgi:dihydroxyacetone kinase
MGDATEFTAAGLASLLREGTDQVMTKGAKPGDKTMVDALFPAAEKAAEVSGESITDALGAVAAAAAAGRDASESMIATMGRAKTLGENSLGKPDAGAVSVAIILAAMSDFAAGL